MSELCRYLDVTYTPSLGHALTTILRWFDADSVHMPNGQGGQKYIVDLVDHLTSWVEACALQRLKADKIADFLFDMMC